MIHVNEPILDNLTRMKQCDNKSVRVFAATVDTMRGSQGFYGRIAESINSLDADGYDRLIDELSDKNFNDAVDVVFFLEA